MKIAFVYSYKTETEWGTPSSIKSAFNKLGHETFLYNLDPNNCNLSKLIDEASNYNFVVVFYAGNSPSLDKELKKLYESNKTKILLELGDEPQTMLGGCNKERINYAHLIFTPDYRCHLYYKQNNYNSAWLTHWCDEDICYYSSVEECIEKAKKLLIDDEYRNKLSNNIYKKITENHLAIHRANSLIEEYSRI